MEEKYCCTCFLTLITFDVLAILLEREREFSWSCWYRVIANVKDVYKCKQFKFRKLDRIYVERHKWYKYHMAVYIVF